jgi:transposase-like protein
MTRHVAKSKKPHVCSPPSLSRSGPYVDIVRWTCPVCRRVFEKRYRVK